MDVPFSNKFLMPCCIGCSVHYDYDNFCMEHWKWPKNIDLLIENGLKTHVPTRIHHQCNGPTMSMAYGPWIFSRQSDNGLTPLKSTRPQFRDVWKHIKKFILFQTDLPAYLHLQTVTTAVFFTEIEFGFLSWIKMDSSADEGRQKYEK